MRSYFSNYEIEELADGMMRQFLGRNCENATEVNIESFITEYLKLPVRYYTFAEQDKDKIGFISDGYSPLSIYDDKRIVKAVFPKGTVIIEKFLQSKSEHARCRFTLAHEAGHYIMDRSVSRASFHREYDNERTYSHDDLKELLNFNESRVDRFAAALLMPRFILKNVMNKCSAPERIPLFGNGLMQYETKVLIHNMATTLGVSFSALLIRLKELKLIEYHSTAEYIEKEFGFGKEVQYP